MEVDVKLQESKLKTVSVGGLALPDGKIQHGFRGCIQVRHSRLLYGSNTCFQSKDSFKLISELTCTWGFLQDADFLNVI